MREEIDRFKLEQQILSAWNVCEDIEIVINMMDGADIDPKDNDRISNILIGLKELYNVKFDQLFNTFEILIKKKQI